MFTGHFAAALAGAGAGRRVSLGLLITAAFGADILEGILAAFYVNDPARVWSHSLPATTTIGLVLALAWRAAGGSWRDAGIVLLVAMSHSALDFVTAVKSVWPGVRSMGFGLYRRPYLEAAIEAGCCVAGWLVWRASLARERRSSAIAWSMLVVLILAQVAVIIDVRTLGRAVDPDALSKFVR